MIFLKALHGYTEIMQACSLVGLVVGVYFLFVWPQKCGFHDKTNVFHILIMEK